MSRTDEWVLSSLLVIATTVVLVLVYPELQHWMVIPTAASGVIVGVDAAAWILGRRDALEPRAMVGLFGVHFFFLAPLLHVAWDYWPQYVMPAQDWRSALGILAIINVLGLVVYRVVVSLRGPASATAKQELDLQRFRSWALIAIAFSLTAYALVLARFSGPVGYLNSVTERAVRHEALAGTGPLLLVGEAWPILIFSYVVVTRAAWLRNHRFALVLLLLGFIIAQFMTGGLRGSRSNTIWPTIMALGMLHLAVKRMSKRVLVAFAIVLFAFMYIYGLYKGSGSGAEVAKVLSGESSASTLEEQTGRTGELVLLEDLGRAGTQALVVDRQASPHTPPPPWGIGYLGDLLKYFPESIIPVQVPDKVDLGTATLYGEQSLLTDWRSSRIYGLVGEGILNFGYIGGVVAFAPLAWLVRYSCAVYRRAQEGGSLSTQVLASALTISAILAIGSDLDNVVWFLMKQALPLAVVLWLSRRRVSESVITIRERSGRR